MWEGFMKDWICSLLMVLAPDAVTYLRDA